jgi:hypothetical protein
MTNFGQELGFDFEWKGFTLGHVLQQQLKLHRLRTVCNAN